MKKIKTLKKNKNFKYTKLILILLLVGNLLTGCWDIREINEIGLVMAIGIDKAENSNAFLVTVVVADPENSNTQGSEAKTDKVWIATGEGKTIFEAVRSISKFATRRIIWSHNGIIIIGERLAGDNINPVADFFTHNSELRMKTGVVVCSGKASKYLSLDTGMEENIGLSLRELMKYHSLTGDSIDATMLSLDLDLQSECKEPIIPMIYMNKDVIYKEKGTKSKNIEQIELAGAAVFKDSKMVGKLTPEETKGVAFIRGEVKGTIISLKEPQNTEKMLTIEVHKIESKISSDISEEIPRIKISVSFEAGIVEEDEVNSLNLEELKSYIEKEVSRIVKNRIEVSIKKIKNEYNSDVFGFGRVVHAEHKKEWNKKYNKIWDEIYRDVKVEVSVNARITNSTLNQETLGER